jgi:hypothetical protein
MSVTQRLTTILNSYTGHTGYDLMLPLSQGTLLAQLTHADALAVSFTSYELQSPRLAQASTKQLTAIADQLATKLTYLLEPLRVLEIDGAAGVVQMRSAPPYKTPEQVTYYEVVVQRGGSISLLRYEKLTGSPRSLRSAIVTKEVFCRIAEDFYATVST